MVLIHFLICALWLSARDVKTLKIRKSNLLLAILSLAPLVNWNQLKFAILNLSLYLLIFSLTQGAIGFGDVRLSFLLGMYIGVEASGFADLVVANFLGWSSAAIYILVYKRKFPLCAGFRVAFAPHLFLGVALWWVI